MTDDGGENGARRQEVDQLSFAIAAQSYRIKATLMRRTSVPLADEFALRAIFILDFARPETLKEFFGYTDAEIVVLLRALHEKQWIEYSGSGVRLSPQGKGLFATSSDGEPMIVDTYPYERSLGFERLSFGPLPVASSRPVPAAIPRVEGDRSKSEDGKANVRTGFRRFFRDIVKESEDRGFRFLDIYSINDIVPKKTFRYVANVPIVANLSEGCRTEALVASVVPGADFGQRHELIAGVAGPVQELRVGGSDTQALSFLSYLAPEFAEFITMGRPWGGTAEATFQDGIGAFEKEAELGLLGSLAVRQSQEKFLEVTGIGDQDVSGECLFWLRPTVEWWGRSESFLNFGEKIREAFGDGQTFLASSDPDLSEREMRRMWGLRGPDRAPQSAFDTGFKFPDGVFPDRFELVLLPRRWCACIVYVELGSQLPLPIGLVSRAAETVDRAHKIFQRLALPDLSKAEIAWDVRSRNKHQAMAAFADGLA